MAKLLETMQAEQKKLRGGSLAWTAEMACSWAARERAAESHALLPSRRARGPDTDDEESDSGLDVEDFDDLPKATSIMWPEVQPCLFPLSELTP